MRLPVYWNTSHNNYEGTPQHASWTNLLVDIPTRFVSLIFLLVGKSDIVAAARKGEVRPQADRAGAGEVNWLTIIACLVLGTWSDIWLSTGCMTTEPYWVTNQGAPSKANQSKSFQCMQMFIKGLFYIKHLISKEPWEHSRYADSPVNLFLGNEKLEYIYFCKHIRLLN